jgi:hypothetical protein
MHQTGLSLHGQARQRDARWNEERAGRKPEIPHYGGCKPARNRRLPGRAPSKMVAFTSASQFHNGHHRGWSTHLASRRCHLAQMNQPHNRSFVTSGGIGTHGMHPPREQAIRKYRVRHHHKIKPLRFPVRADTAVRPYAEVLSPAARTGCCKLRSVTTTAQRDPRERTATGEQQRDGARLWRDVVAWVGDLDVASSPSHPHLVARMSNPHIVCACYSASIIYGQIG